MDLDKEQKQKDPPEKDVKFILNLLNSNKFIDTEKEINKKIINYPNSSILFNIRGAVLSGQNKLHEAIDNYNKAIKINPAYAQAYNNLGIAFYKLKEINIAIEKYKKAISLKENFFEALNNFAGCMSDLGKFKEAEQFYIKSIKINPSYAEAHYGLGHVYNQLALKEKAKEQFVKALKINKNFVDAYLSLGNLYHEQLQFDEAISNYKKAIELKPNFEKAYNNLGIVLGDLGKFEEALSLFYKAINIKSNYTKAYSNILFNLSATKNFNSSVYLSNAKKFRLNCGLSKNEKFQKYQFDKKSKRLKVGFISADFGEHPGGHFTLSTFRELKKKNFNLVAYSNFDRKDGISNHFKNLFNEWNLISNQSDKKVAEKIRKDGIHILIDLQGHSLKNRLPIFCYKPAPVQATWLGQGSTGIPEIDYFIGSPHITPIKEEKYYVEKVLRLPKISQCFTSPDFDIQVNNLPAIKNNFFTFGCVNKFYKLNDEVISLWAKILQSVPKSKLLLKAKEFDNKKIFNETIEKFNKYKIKKENLILIGRSNTRKEVLEIYNQIDIALDPFPFQGNTSTCEAVWMGVPVMTLKGNRYLFHFGESINFNLNMSHWIANNHEEYIAKTIEYSRDLNELSRIRENLRSVALKSPVFDASSFGTHFSNMLWDIWKKYNIESQDEK